MLLFNYHVLFLIILEKKKKKQQQPYRELFRPKGTLLIVFLIEVFSVFVVTLNAPAQYFLVFVFLFLGGGVGRGVGGWLFSLPRTELMPRYNTRVTKQLHFRSV